MGILNLFAGQKGNNTNHIKLPTKPLPERILPTPEKNVQLNGSKVLLLQQKNLGKPLPTIYVYTSESSMRKYFTNGGFDLQQTKRYEFGDVLPEELNTLVKARLPKPLLSEQLELEVHRHSYRDSESMDDLSRKLKELHNERYPI